MNASSPPGLEKNRPVPLSLNGRRLNKPYMYKKVFEGGRVLRSAPLTVRYFHVDQECSRFGFVLRKKVGDAPMRNSIRRTLRQCFVEALPRIPEGTWIVFDVSNQASQSTRKELRSQADKLLATMAWPGNAVASKQDADAPAPEKSV